MIASPKPRTILPDSIISGATETPDRVIGIAQFKKSDSGIKTSAPIFLEKASKSLGLSRINDLLKEISEIQGIESVKIAFQVPGDFHAVIFQIKLLNSFDNNEELDDELEIEESERIWEATQKLVLETCKNLRDITNEKWYFRTQLVCDFNDEI